MDLAFGLSGTRISSWEWFQSWFYAWRIDELGLVGLLNSEVLKFSSEISIKIEKKTTRLIDIGRVDMQFEQLHPFDRIFNIEIWQYLICHSGTPWNEVELAISWLKELEIMNLWLDWDQLEEGWQIARMLEEDVRYDFYPTIYAVALSLILVLLTWVWCLFFILRAYHWNFVCVF